MEEASARSSVEIRCGLLPGDIGSVVYLHGRLYAEEQGWDHTFEAYVAGPLAEFAMRQSPRERIWVVEEGGRVAGSVAIVEASAEQAQLRWLLVHPRLRGRGVGRALMARAVDFSRDRGYAKVFLWTVSALAAAAELYRSFGFELTEEQTHELWGATVTEQRYELALRETPLELPTQA